MSARDLGRLFRPRSIAVVGGREWCRAVVRQGRNIGFAGDIWPVHPTADAVSGVPAFRDVRDLPEPPDATFIGVNRVATVDIVRDLETIGAGGAVCFASGFSEAEAEDILAPKLQADLVAAAGDMPILGPNCYGFINYLDGALLWPDQHGGERVERGVAIIAQSSNIALNLTMQCRALPLACIVTVGNQAQTGFAEIGAALLADERVTALGLHIEGIGDLAAFEYLARRAAALGKPVIVLKVGKSETARAATASHTASLAGGDAGASALFQRFAIPRLNTLPEFLETLKLLHVCGPLHTNRIASISCSGGEAALVADMAASRNLTFPPLNARQKNALETALGPMVALANPLDYHTHIWRDVDAMTRAWMAMMDPALALTLLIVDFPRTDRSDASDWECAVSAAIALRAQSKGNVAMVASLPELMPEAMAKRLLAEGVAPVSGLDEALAAAEAAAFCGNVATRIAGLEPLLPPGPEPAVKLVMEHEAKVLLASAGMGVPRGIEVRDVGELPAAAGEIGYPVVLKGKGIAHKTEAGAVALELETEADLHAAAKDMRTDGFLLEEMVKGGVAELLVGVVRDAAHGYVLTIAAGGTLAELMDDRRSLLIPARRRDVVEALEQLRFGLLLAGFRGRPAADSAAVVDAVMALQDIVVTRTTGLGEFEINPLICCPDRAVAADVLLRCEGIS
ncbi:MAG: acetate--CoA ligase family protein [Paracoccaceae bacterium]